MLHFIKQYFALYKILCRKISQTFASFWWKKKADQNRGIHWKSWTYLTLPKVKGGLGFKDILLFNRALIAKQLWKLLTRPNLLVCKVLKAKYFPQESLFTVPKKKNGSWLWNSWIEVRDSMQEGARYDIRDGKSMKIWEFPWVPSLLGFKLSSSPTDTTTHLIWVKDLIDQTGRHWNTQLVQSTFTDTEAQTILNIKSLDPLTPDMLVWDSGTNGAFSVSSTYSKLVAQKMENNGLCREQQSLNKTTTSEARIHLSTYILWWLWKARNLWIFEDSWMEDKIVAELAGKDWGQCAAILILVVSAVVEPFLGISSLRLADAHNGLGVATS
ncbi:RNA-directed DNA polymerase [Striga asiatica]|uniref:RNA-directed DNA polymerase n=1 Tax=Striga asiatica TaxID=4170 RepID=A0A5A7NX39_STRAF|nr:RNA-directed DNA polymerase [Striga asiatica]